MFFGFSLKESYALFTKYAKHMYFAMVLHLTLKKILQVLREKNSIIMTMDFKTGYYNYFFNATLRSHAESSL